MKGIKNWIMMCALLGGAITNANAQTPSVKEIVQRADAKMRGESAYSEMTMTIVRPTYQRSISMRSWTKADRFALIKITAPAKDKGSGYLKRDAEMWNWLPSINRMIKMNASVMGQSWMGSDFTNDDMVKESSMVRDYQSILLGSKNLRETECYQIELTPHVATAVVWGKCIVWVAKSDYSIIRTENYDEDGILAQTLDNYDFKNFGGRIMPTRIEIIPAGKKGQRTVVTVHNAEYNKPMADSHFSQQNLKTLQEWAQ